MKVKRSLKQKEVTKEMTAWATEILKDPKTYPMGAEVERTYSLTLDGAGAATEERILARVEHHTFQGKTGKHGNFRGVSLYLVEPDPDDSSEPCSSV